MKARWTLAAAVAMVGLLVPGTATAKGPSQATIDGPGLGSSITFTGDGEGQGTKLGDFANEAGFFPAMFGLFGQSPNPMLGSRPKGYLGPRYTVTYTVAPTDDRVRQDLYPYAVSGPVTYTQPGQRFFQTHYTTGGWFRALPGLKAMLVEAGLPATAPHVSSSRFAARELVIAGVVLFLLAGLGARFGRSSIARWLPRRSTSAIRAPSE